MVETTEQIWRAHPAYEMAIRDALETARAWRLAALTPDTVTALNGFVGELEALAAAGKARQGVT